METIMENQSMVPLNNDLFKALKHLAQDTNQSISHLLDRFVEEGLKHFSKKDDSLMTEEEYMAKLEHSAEQARQGKVHRMRRNETAAEFFTRIKEERRVRA